MRRGEQDLVKRVLNGQYIDRFVSEDKYELAKRTLRDIIKIFNEEDIPYFLDYGTLLGCIRNHDLIRMDGDLDFGILAEYDREDLIQLLSTINYEGFKFANCSRRMPEASIDKYCILSQELEDLRNEGKLDHTLFIRGKSFKIRPEFLGVSNHPVIGVDIYRHHTLRKNPKRRIMMITGKTCPKEYIQSTKKTTFLGVEVNVPIEPEKYLACLYSNWKDPWYPKWLREWDKIHNE